jgi:MoaA/NifB/PqqE/SkfB family radical SAM enzyme
MPSGCMDLKGHICTRPFEWLEIHPGGQTFLCCPSWLKTSLGNILSSPLEKIWNGPEAVAIRKSILNGSFHYCKKSRCPKLMTRTAPVLLPGMVPDDVVMEAIAEGRTTLHYRPKTLNLCFDPSCNLACPSCRSTPSTLSGEENEKIALLCRIISEDTGREAQNLTLSGTGDPFASSPFRSLLQGFRASDFPLLKTIHLHTNGQLWDEKMWSTMREIHPYVKSAEISVDAATPGTYAANRGGDFVRLLRNLEFISRLPIDLKISMVVQANNFREMPAFAAIGQKLGFSVYFGRLVNWGTFTREEFQTRAVHQPGHPEHALFLEILLKVADMPRVDLGNLRLHE